MNAKWLATSLFTLMVLLTACASPPTLTFTLDPVSPSAPLTAVASVAPIRIDGVHLPAWLNRPELVRETSGQEMKVDDFAIWSGPLAQLARRTLTQDLLARLPQGAVVFPDSPAPAGTVGIVVDILDLSRSGDHVGMDVSWTVLRPQPSSPGTAAPVSSHPSHVSAFATPEAQGASARDLSALLAALADEIAASATASRLVR